MARPDLSARFEVVARHRPVRLVVPGSGIDGRLEGAPAPYVATQARRTGPGPAELALSAPGLRMLARYDADGVGLEVSASGRTTTHRSRRRGRPTAPVDAVGLALTGSQVTAFTFERGAWVARARFDLTERADTPDVHGPDCLAGLRASAAGPLDDVESGRFGQLGLRDLRVVTHADGTPYSSGDPGDAPGTVLLTASSSGPGWFPTGHASVWALDTTTLDLEHRADLFLRRGGGVYGDHAVQLVRDVDDGGAGRWLLAASTWGDFDAERRPVSVVLGTSTADLTHGVHVVDAEPLPLPTDGLRSVGVWDQHLVHDGGQWLVTYVSATRYFRFHPVLASGPSLDDLTLRAADPRRRECEGTTLLRTDAGWRVLASDKHSRSYPVLDLDLRETGRLDAAYPSNIPWPTLVTDPAGRTLLLGFDGETYGGDLTGYGTHGQVVVQRSSTSVLSR